MAKKRISDLNELDSFVFEPAVRLIKVHEKMGVFDVDYARQTSSLECLAPSDSLRRLAPPAG